MCAASGAGRRGAAHEFVGLELRDLLAELVQALDCLLNALRLVVVLRTHGRYLLHVHLAQARRRLRVDLEVELNVCQLQLRGALEAAR